MQSAFDLLPALRGERNLMVVADFDLTLVGHTDWPEEPRMTDKERGVIIGLFSRLYRVAVLTSRGLEKVTELSGLSPDSVIFAANNGLRIAGSGIDWSHPHVQRENIIRAIERVKGVLVAARDVKTLVEDKDLTFAVHWWPREPNLVRFNEDITGALDGLPVRVRPASVQANMEIEPNIPWNKGLGLLRLNALTGYRGMVVAAGDSAADDPLFEEVQRTGGYGIQVGERDGSKAYAFVENCHALYHFFRQLGSNT